MSLKEIGFNGHPPLGVNATAKITRVGMRLLFDCFNGHPPLGVNATWSPRRSSQKLPLVSMGTHPWG